MGERQSGTATTGLATTALALAIDPKAPQALYVQIYRQIRDMILDGRIPAGAPLPSTRALVRDLGVSRTTLLQAFDQLRGEGLVEGAVGSGTYAAQVPTRTQAGASAGAPTPTEDAAPARDLARRAHRLGPTAPMRRATARPFAPGTPEIAKFPFAHWSRLTARFWRSPPPEMLLGGAAAGYEPLRRAIAGHLRQVRGLACEADQVIVTTGTREAIELLVRALVDPGDAVWVEEPGYAPVRNALALADARPVPVPVTAGGIDIAAARHRCPSAAMAVVTPSRQYPLGITMTLATRLALLDWARTAGAWVVEDDYDSEFRYTGLPIPPLQSLDATGRVLYLGSFSKVLFPTLRLGYIVAPPSLADALLRTRAAFGEAPSIAAQPVLAAFMDEGHFAQHVRRMRRLYAERRRALLAAAETHWHGLLRVEPPDGGLHLIARLDGTLAARARTGRIVDREISQRAWDQGIAAPPLSAYASEPNEVPGDAQGLLVGFGGVPEEVIDDAAQRLAEVLAAPARLRGRRDRRMR